jgi:ubiquinone/menaquinone biosynthesis C-methylase UbiE
MRLTVRARLDNGIWFPQTTSGNPHAAALWSDAARTNAVRAAAATDDPDPFAKYPEWIKACLPRPVGTLLDAGCGYGRVSIPLLQLHPGLRCVGIDASPVMLGKYQELGATHGVMDRVELHCGHLEALPFPDGSFEYLISCAVLLHLAKSDVRRAIQEFRRVLAKGGTLILAGAFPNVFNLESAFNLPNNFRRSANGPVRAYTRREVHRLFDGFSTIDVRAHQLIVLPRSLGPLRMPLAGLSRRVNQYCTRRFIHAFTHSGCLVNHHDVIATR